MTFSADERRALADALEAAGPDAPTLCAGWTTRDLAAHLVVRERRPDSGPGILLPPLHRWTERVRLRAAGKDYGDLVRLIRSGPPRLGWTALPGVDATVNLNEHFVHLEDVRRAVPGWQPRTLLADRQRALWRALTRAAPLLFRAVRTGLVLATPDGRQHVVREAGERVVLTGEPGELLLVGYGRGAHARFTVEGDESAVARLRATTLRV